jgi:DNA-damage-inducible protein J
MEVKIMAKTSSMYIRIDPEIKAEVEAIYARMGISLTQAITTFLYQSRNAGGFPFQLRAENPNAETRAAIEEVRRMKVDPSLGKAYTDVDQMMEELLSDVHS